MINALPLKTKMVKREDKIYIVFGWEALPVIEVHCDNRNIATVIHTIKSQGITQ